MKKIYIDVVLIMRIVRPLCFIASFSSFSRFDLLSWSSRLSLNSSEFTLGAGKKTTSLTVRSQVLKIELTLKMFIVYSLPDHNPILLT